MAIKILANDGISDSGKEALEKEGFEVITTKVAQNQLIDYINKHAVDVLLVRSATQVRKDIIDGCPSLKLIGRGGVGMDNIDVDYAQSKNLHVINTPASSANSVAELVFAHLFTGVRFLHDANRNMPLEGDTQFNELKKNYTNGTELRGKTIGIIGFGRSGQAVARIALDFFNGQTIPFTIKTVEKERLLMESDFITLNNSPAQGGYVLDNHEFNLMKEGVGVINLARGGALNEVALIEALEHGKVAFAGLDVFENEPNPAIQVLMHPQISLTPHIGASTNEAQNRIGFELASQIATLLK